MTEEHHNQIYNLQEIKILENLACVIIMQYSCHLFYQH